MKIYLNLKTDLYSLSSVLDNVFGLYLINYIGTGSCLRSQHHVTVSVH
jgi:hypothetical protein